MSNAVDVPVERSGRTTLSTDRKPIKATLTVTLPNGQRTEHDCTMTPEGEGAWGVDAPLSLPAGAVVTLSMPPFGEGIRPGDTVSLRAISACPHEWAMIAPKRERCNHCGDERGEGAADLARSMSMRPASP